jgi:hypothetical protein
MSQQSFVNLTVPLVEMIDAYLGVLYFWTNEANRSAMPTGDDLRGSRDFCIETSALDGGILSLDPTEPRARDVRTLSGIVSISIRKISPCNMSNR